LISEALAQTGSTSGGGFSVMTLMPIILMFVIIYFLLLRPQQKRQKQQQAMLNSLKKNDQVITAGGLLGTIVGLKEKQGTILLRVADTVKIEVVRSSIARIIPRGEGEQSDEGQLDS